MTFVRSTRMVCIGGDKQCKSTDGVTGGTCIVDDAGMAACPPDQQFISDHQVRDDVDFEDTCKRCCLDPAAP